VSEKRISRQQEAFLVHLLEEGELWNLPYRMLMSATALEREGLVENTGRVWRLTERGRVKAELYKTWQDQPELRPKRGGVLKKGRLTRHARTD